MPFAALKYKRLEFPYQVQRPGKKFKKFGGMAKFKVTKFFLDVMRETVHKDLSVNAGARFECSKKVKSKGLF